MLALTASQAWTLTVFGALLGAAIGSFCCVIIERMPVQLDEPNEWGDAFDTRPWREVVGGESRCSSCGSDIRWIDKIPVLSWFLLRGKCRTCSERIPGFHPVVEFLVPVLAVGLVAVAGWDWRLLPALWLVPVGVVVSAIDLRTYIVPTRIVWPAFFVAIVLSIAACAAGVEWSRLWYAALGVVFIAGPLAVLWFILPNAMGFGDVRLATLLGWVVAFSSTANRIAHLGFLAAIFFVSASVIGITMGIGGLMAQGRKAKVPFGPALFVSAMLLVALSQQILDPFL
ncbi:MAG: prepilin peptidase [Microthrixaceae bacterium]|nr:prepilin peptidase [Microthrixaceae bacterium]